MSSPDPSRPDIPASRPIEQEDTLPSVATPLVPNPPLPAVLGPYSVIRQLGLGGMGMVLLAEDLALQRRVALKVMRPELAADPVSRERFLREARACAAIKYDHLVTIYAVAEADTPAGRVPYLAMEYLEGESLETRLQREPILPVAEVMRIAWETASGLAAAHAKGLVHRDIKPGNLWLEAPYGRIKILDFGLARPVQGSESDLTNSGQLLGTPAYVSPEQARGLPLDGRADLFSLGCVLYRCATGRKPFLGNSILAVLTALAVDHPPSPHLVNAAIPVGLSATIMQLLEKDPNRRPVSAHALLGMLATLAQSASSPPPAPVVDSTFAFESSVERPLVVPLPKTPLQQEPRWLAPLLFGLGLLLMGGLFTAAWFLTRPTPLSQEFIEDEPDPPAPTKRN